VISYFTPSVRLNLISTERSFLEGFTVTKPVWHYLTRESFVNLQDAIIQPLATLIEVWEHPYSYNVVKTNYLTYWHWVSILLLTCIFHGIIYLTVMYFPRFWRIELWKVHGEILKNRELHDQIIPFQIENDPVLMEFVRKVVEIDDQMLTVESIVDEIVPCGIEDETLVSFASYDRKIPHIHQTPAWVLLRDYLNKFRGLDRVISHATLKVIWFEAHKFCDDRRMTLKQKLQVINKSFVAILKEEPQHQRLIDTTMYLAIGSAPNG